MSDAMSPSARNRSLASLSRAAASVDVNTSVLVLSRPSTMSNAFGISAPVRYMKSLFWE